MKKIFLKTQHRGVDQALQQNLLSLNNWSKKPKNFTFFMFRPFENESVSPPLCLPIQFRNACSDKFLRNICD